MRSIIETAGPATAKSGATLQAHVVGELRREIENGLWPPGAKLPSINVLCGRYRVSNITVRNALRELARCGLVESRPRSGVYVRRGKAKQPASDNRTIGLIITNNRHALYAEIITGAEAVCAANGYAFLIAISDDDPQIEAEQIARLSERSAGLLITPNTAEVAQEAFRTLRERDIPFVQLVRYVPGMKAPAVASDNQRGGYLATQHLCEVGCDEVYLLSDYDDSAARERRAGYEAALQELDLRPHAILHKSAHHEHGEAVGYGLMKKALKDHARRGGGGRIGVFALNLQLARGSYLALKEAHLAVPQDVAVVGFDDVGAAFFDPPLTTVRQDIMGIGRRAAELLLEVINGRASMNEPASVCLQPELIIRNSTDTASDYCLKQNKAVASKLPGVAASQRVRECVGAL